VKLSLRKCLLPIAIGWVLLGVWGHGGAQTGALNKDPAGLLKKYLSLDIKGARLHPLSWEAQKPYIAWKEEPVWGRIVVVTDYTVKEDLSDWKVLNNVDVVIPVQFKVLGSVYLEQATFRAEPEVEQIKFHVKAVNGLWRIVDPLIPPHVGQKRMVNFVRQALLEENDPSHQAALTMLWNDLKKAQ
jgi:hypothetical protein